MWATSNAEASVANPCVWPIEGDCTLNSDHADAVVEITQQAAIEILHAATGRQFGQCVYTAQPCRAGCATSFAPLDMWSLLDVRGSFTPTPWEDAYYTTMVCSSCATDRCSCVDLEQIDLWHRNITEIISVQIDGVELDPANYRLWKRRLIRTDGDVWPDCQDFTVPNGELGTWSVSYRHGRPVPAAGQLAAGILACELAKAICGDTSCQLPKRVQTITRQGVSVAFVDPMQFLADGLTGLYLPDLWIRQINPARLQRRARAFRADAPRRGRSRVANWDVFGGS